MRQVVKFFLIGALAVGASRTAVAFNSNGRWNPTATNGATGPVGTSVTVTWSLVDDGTLIPGEGPSNLLLFLDNTFGGEPAGSDLTLRPWFQFFDNSFDRWSELSGLTFAYEPADDGAELRGLGGASAVRGDIRIGGAFLDGDLGTLASTGFLNDADVTIDTGDATYYGDSAPLGAFQNIHNTLMHEIGHAFGLGHIQSSTSAFLMEAFTNTTINGPQLDDIRGIHYLYGDANEKGAGNNSPPSATPLGVVTAGATILQGEHASTGTSVLMGESDFLSISSSNDSDYFSFEVTSTSLVDLVVTPLGPTYNERANVGDTFTTTTSASLSDLSLELFASGSAVPLASSTSNPIGHPESILDVELLNPGEYVFRVSGSSALTQLYQFSLAVESLRPGDFNTDGDVDGADFLAWQRGESPDPLSSEDLTLWQENYGATAVANHSPVPEPSGLAHLALLAVVAGLRSRTRQSLEADN
jgi:serralysin